MAGAIPSGSDRSADGTFSRSSTFVVQLRNKEARSWGNQTEIVAGSAKEAAEQASGSSLREGFGDRVDLRARVWPTPFGSRPDIPFYEDKPL